MSEWDFTDDIGSVRTPPRQHCPQSARSLIQSCTRPPLGQKRRPGDGVSCHSLRTTGSTPGSHLLRPLALSLELQHLRQAKTGF